MRKSEYRITLDFHETAMQAALRMKKRDTERRIVATLSEDGNPYVITAGCRAVFTAKRPDGGIVVVECEINGDIVSCNVTEPTTLLPGVVECEIKIYGVNDALLTSPRFVLIVDDTIYTTGDPVDDGGGELVVEAVGIESIEQTFVSPDDGGTNELTIITTDGAVTKFYVKNGNRGSQGERGEVGPAGPAGASGSAGKDGEPGKDGVTPTFSIGTVSTLAPGSNATATISGTVEKPVLNLGIPKGEKGDKGDAGEGGGGEVIDQTARDAASAAQSKADSAYSLASTLNGTAALKSMFVYADGVLNITM